MDVNLTFRASGLQWLSWYGGHLRHFGDRSLVYVRWIAILGIGGERGLCLGMAALHLLDRGMVACAES